MSRQGIMAGLLYVPAEEVLPDGLRRYTLANPAWEQAKRAGAKIPKCSRDIYAYRRFRDFIGFPPYVEPALVANPGFQFNDIRTDGEVPLKIAFDVNRARSRQDLFFHQERAVATMHSRGHGILVANPGQGKTNVMLWLLSLVGKSAVVFVHKGELVDQWRNRALDWTDIKPEDIGTIKESKRAWDGQPLCIAMLDESYMSLYEDKDFKEFFGVAMADECLSMDTTISTPHGEAIFRDLHVGHRLWSFNFKTQRMEEDVILAESIKGDYIYEVDVQIGHATRTVRCSANHPFYHADGTKTQAIKLQVGQKVLTA